MSQASSSGDWTTEVIKYLKRNIPEDRYLPDPSRRAWSHAFMTAWQIGCEALAKLGVADEFDGGAIARTNPELPDPLPRWDDICVAVLGLANHFGHLKYPPSHPHAATAPDVGGFLVGKELVPVLEALGLAKGSSVTKAAETIFWREGWSGRVDVTRDPRFTQAVATACETIPADIRAEMDRLVTITEDDVAKALVRYNAVQERNRDRELQRNPASAARRTYKPITVEDARKNLESFRAGELDWLFFRRWRLADGWLSGKEAERALEIFHDSLAIRMRRAVVSGLYDGLVLGDGR